MTFHVYRCKKDQDTFIVTADAHADQVTNRLCPTPDDELEKVGVFSEMGKERAAFDETLATNSIDSQGYYRFEAKSFNPVAEWPLAMP
jgi:hypothetical protein